MMREKDLWNDQWGGTLGCLSCSLLSSSSGLKAASLGKHQLRHLRMTQGRGDKTRVVIFGKNSGRLQGGDGIFSGTHRKDKSSGREVGGNYQQVDQEVQTSIAFDLVSRAFSPSSKSVCVLWAVPGHSSSGIFPGHPKRIRTLPIAPRSRGSKKSGSWLAHTTKEVASSCLEPARTQCEKPCVQGWPLPCPQPQGGSLPA